MKKAVALLLMVLLLSGCSSMLNRPYQVVVAHEYHATAGEGSGIPDAETYQALVNNIFSFVEDGVEQGVIRLTNYRSKTGDVAGDLSAACNEVANEDPLGAYAVDFIKSDYTRVVKYYEANISITYRRSPEQIKSLVNVTGSSAIREELRQTLREFQSETALRVGYLTEDKAYIASLIRQAYYDTPEAALGMPLVTISLYPEEAESGPRIVEIQLKYPEEREALRKASEAVQREVAVLSTSFYGQQGRTAAAAICQVLQEQADYTPGGGNTAYDALVEGQADSEGMALAYELLSQQADLETMLVHGTLNGEGHIWNLFRQADGQWRHIDSTQEEVTSLTDAEMAAVGYVWNEADFPVCEESGVLTNWDSGTMQKVEKGS